jgi:hypothetical protein
MLKTVSKFVPQKKHHPTKTDDHESVSFVFDNNDVYLVAHHRLTCCWVQNVFQVTYTICTALLVACLLLLCCLDSDFGFCKLSERQVDTLLPRVQKRTSIKFQAQPRSAYCFYTLSFHIPQLCPVQRCITIFFCHV